MNHAKLIVHEDSPRGSTPKKRAITVSSESVTIGTQETSDIRLSSREASFSIEIKFSQAAWWILNPLRSPLIRVNDKPLALERRLESGDKIRIAGSTILFETLQAKQRSSPPLKHGFATDAELWQYLLEDNEFDEVLINGPKSIFVDWRGSLAPTPYQFSHSDFLTEKIIKSSKTSGPWASWRIDRSLRIQAILPPAASEPHICIRRSKTLNLGFEDLEKQRFGSPDQMDFILRSLDERQNILVAGGTSTGKTVLLRAMIERVSEHQRIVLLEEDAEINWRHNHLVSIECGRGNLNQALIESLRLRPDRIIVSEVRGVEALEMLQAMNTGHSGSMTTIHANSTREALLRLETLVLAGNPSLTVAAVRRMIAHAIQVVVQLSRDSEGRRFIDQISKISGFQNETILFSDPLKVEPKGLQQRTIPDEDET